MSLYRGVMKEKFYGKYRIPSSRLAAWDYGRNAAYFVTICTANHAHYFGKITHGEMIPTPLGQAAVDFWNEIPAHFPFVVLDAFVVMPNHVHGIIIIDKSADTVETQDRLPRCHFGVRLYQLETGLDRNRETWHPLCAGIKLASQNMPARTMPRLYGKSAITITLSAARTNMNSFGNIFSPIH